MGSRAGPEVETGVGAGAGAGVGAGVGAGAGAGAWGGDTPMGGGGGFLSDKGGADCMGSAFTLSICFLQNCEFPTLFVSVVSTGSGSGSKVTDLLPAIAAAITEPSINRIWAISIVCRDFIQVLKHH
jgi:hypothetical protein